MCLYGAIGRRSLSELMEKMAAQTQKTPTCAMAVLRFHAAGVAHQPPYGVQTCMFVRA